jgi:hypothetical protein
VRVDLRDTMIKLRQDAIQRDMKELVVVYGWSAIRLGIEVLEEGFRLRENRGCADPT